MLSSIIETALWVYPIPYIFFIYWFTKTMDDMSAATGSPETDIGEKAVNFPGHGKCIKVPTGGVIPAGADAMVPFEDTKADGNETGIRWEKSDDP